MEPEIELVWICTPNEELQSEFEFWPIEHPTEPMDEDQPIKCPVPGSCVVNKEKMQREKGSLIAEVSPSSEKREERLVTLLLPEEPPVQQSMRKRHHTLTHGDHTMAPLLRMPPHYPYPPQHFTIFDVVQQFNKFES